uniref:AIG1-type G domain-containing protein n=1 Tax=Setaria viridis TaxID=4556 RepID=A0A4U6TST0_SETVI|nr:hypothetical protein SEVIR_7G115000v2 [Setaria viridis]
MRSTTRSFGDAAAPRAVNVIDTPGLFDMNASTTEDARKEIAKCMDLSKDGIHAMLLVFSAATRFSDEDVNTVASIKMFFGDSISNHMILVFTNGDQVGESTLKKMLSNKRARYLQELVRLCAHRVVLFDNRTSDAACQQQQLKKLLEAVDSVISDTDEVHGRQKEIDVEGYTAEEMSQSKKDMYDQYLMLITKMVI